MYSFRVLMKQLLNLSTYILKQMDADLISRDKLISDCKNLLSHRTVTSTLDGCASWFISQVERKRWNVWMREKNRTASREFTSYLKVSFAILCRYKSATWFNYSIKPPPAINLHAKRCRQDWGFFDLLLHSVKCLTIQIDFCCNYLAKCRSQSSAHFITDSWGLDALLYQLRLWNLIYVNKKALYQHLCLCTSQKLIQGFYNVILQSMRCSWINILWGWV